MQNKSVDEHPGQVILKEFADSLEDVLDEDKYDLNLTGLSFFNAIYNPFFTINVFNHQVFSISYVDGKIRVTHKVLNKRCHFEL